MTFNEEDFADVTRALRSCFAADRLPRSLRDDVLRALERGPARKRRARIAPLAAAALFLAGLAVLLAFPRDSRPSPADGRPGAAQESDRQRLEQVRREIARVKDEIRTLEEDIAQASKRPVAPPATRQAPPIRVTAVALEIGLAVISTGTEDGIVNGARFWIYRNDVVIGQIVIDRTDLKWSAGKIVMKVMDPKVGDSVVPSN